MKKYYIFLFALLFLFYSTYLSSAETGDLFYSKSLLLDVKIDSWFNLVSQYKNPDISFVRAELQFFPENNSNQQVIYSVTAPNAEKKEDYFEFYWKNPQLGKYTYLLDTKVKTFNRLNHVNGKIGFPSKNIDPSLEIYLRPTEKIDINEEIIAQASGLAQGEDDLFKVVFNLASWTKKNINYSLDTQTAEASQKASWVLKNKYGVCDELTNLFIAMARSLGIPARFVSGIAYTNSELFTEKWGLHGWAEVYFPGYGWLPFDPTYGQYGQIDATHIKLKDSTDSDKSSTRFEWKANDVELNPGSLHTNVQIMDQDEKNFESINMKIIPLSDEVDFGSYNLIQTKLENKENAYVGFEISLSKPKEVVIKDDPIKFILLEPYEEKSVFWIVSVNEDLSRKYIYTFPLEVSNSLGYSSKGEFRSSYNKIDYDFNRITKILSQLQEQDKKIYSKNLEIDCSFPKSVFLNESFNLDCLFRNSGNIFLDNINACSEQKQCNKFDLGIAQSKNLSFQIILGKIGEQDISINAENSEINTVKLIKIFVEDKPKIELKDIQYPERVEYGPDFDISFDIWKYSLANPENITVFFRFNEKETSWKLEELESNQIFEVKLDRSLLNPTENLFEIVVYYHDSKNNLYIERFDKKIELENPGIFGRIEIWLNKLSRNIEKLLT